MIVEAFGIVDHSPIEVSAALQRLRVSHTLAFGLPYQQQDLDGLSKQQPLWPIVTDLRSLRKVVAERAPSVLFVVGSRAQLAETNINREFWRSADVAPAGADADLRQCLLSVDPLTMTPWVYANNAMSLSQYVAIAAKPAFLSEIQTALYSINPYPVRKEMQAAVIAYLDGRVPGSKLKTMLSASLRFDRLEAVLNTERASQLKDAVARVKAGEAVENVAREMQFEIFEILYIQKSSENRLKAESPRGKPAQGKPGRPPGSKTRK